MQSLYHYYQIRILEALQDNHWYLSRPKGTTAHIEMIGIEDRVSPTGFPFSVLLFNVRVGAMIGKFKMSLINEQIEWLDEELVVD